jgi:hypothetical protein
MAGNVPALIKEMFLLAVSILSLKQGASESHFQQSTILARADYWRRCNHSDTMKFHGKLEASLPTSKPASGWTLARERASRHPIRQQADFLHKLIRSACEHCRARYSATNRHEYKTT